MRVPLTPLLGSVLLCSWSLSLFAADEDLPLTDDEKALRSAGIQTDGESLLKFFRERTPSAADLDKLAGWIAKLGDSSFQVREQAGVELVKWGRWAAPLLKKALNDKDPEIARRAGECLQKIGDEGFKDRARAAARLLAAKKPAGAVEALFHYLPLADDDLQEDLVLALNDAGIREGKAAPVLVAALKDRDVLKRSAAARVVGRSPQADEQSAVVPLLKDPQAVVRLRAAQGLLTGKRKEAVPALIALLSEAPLTFADDAEDWLRRLGGDKSPDVSLGPSEIDRRMCREVWNRWWQEHEKAIDLAAVDLQYRKPKLPVIAPVAFNRRPDVIFVPTPQEVVDQMLDLAKVKKRDVVYDLGCGDGRVVITAAAKVGAFGFGFDIDPDRVKEAEQLVKKNKVDRLVTIRQADVFTLDLKDATVIYLYLLPSLNVKLIPQLEKCKPGTRIISHDFDMPGVKRDQVHQVKVKGDRERTLYLWTTPLKRER